MGNWQNKEQERSYNTAYYAQNGEHLREYAKAYYYAKKDGTFVPRVPESAGMTTLEAKRLWSRRAQEKLRKKAIDSLGGPKCKHCGFSDERALQIDHVNGGGVEERKRIGWKTMLRRVIQQPHEYQVLCANCNWIKRAERGEHVKRL